MATNMIHLEPAKPSSLDYGSTGLERFNVPLNNSAPHFFFPNCIRDLVHVCDVFVHLA